MPAILLDSNILVYVVDAHQVERQEKAIGLVRSLAQTRSGRLSAQCLSEFMSVSIKKLGLSPAEAIGQVERWVRVFPVFPLTPQIILEAARGVRDHGLAYYDAQIWAAARLGQISIVFSEDFQEGQVLEGVRFINPFAPAFDLDEWL